jgi:hypothetical protein
MPDRAQFRALLLAARRLKGSAQAAHELAFAKAISAPRRWPKCPLRACDRQMTTDAMAYYRGLIAAYTDAIRISDFKANVAVIYGAFTISPVISFSDRLPPFLPLAAVLAPFMIVFFCLLVCLFPRYPRRGRDRFLISRKAEPDDFIVPDDHESTIDQQLLLCGILCNILYWKTLCLRISFNIYIWGTVATTLMVGYSMFRAVR